MANNSRKSLKIRQILGKSTDKLNILRKNSKKIQIFT